MFRLFRPLERGEFFVVWGDTSQGGEDSNVWMFLSKTKRDIPLMFRARGAAAEHTMKLVEALEYIYNKTGVRPVVALERQNGGASEMHRLYEMNRHGKYRIYYAKNFSDERVKNSDKMGWDTTTITRPMMIGEWKQAFAQQAIRIYDETTIKEHKVFVTNNKGKPEASSGNHDDCVMACAGVWQMYQTEDPQVVKRTTRTRKWDPHTGRPLN